MTSDPAIIEAAARALRECNCDTYDEWYEDTAQAVLAAITPLIRAAALEEAAKVADEFELHHENKTACEVARAIRALKEKP